MRIEKYGGDKYDKLTYTSTSKDAPNRVYRVRILAEHAENSEVKYVELMEGDNNSTFDAPRLVKNKKIYDKYEVPTTDFEHFMRTYFPFFGV